MHHYQEKRDDEAFKEARIGIKEKFKHIKSRTTGFLSLMASCCDLRYHNKYEESGEFRDVKLLTEDELSRIHDASELALFVDDKIVAIIKFLSTKSNSKVRYGIKADAKIMAVRAEVMTPLQRLELQRFHEKGGVPSNRTLKLDYK